MQWSVLFALCAGASPALGSEPSAIAPTAIEPLAAGPLLHPDGPGEGRWRLGVGAQVDVLPLNLVESELRQVPRLTAHWRRGLAWGFSFDAKLSAVVVANELQAGLAWGRRVGPITLGVHHRLAFWFGFVGVQGFDTTGLGLMNLPGLSVGLAAGRTRLTASAEMLTVQAQYVRLGEASAGRTRFYLAGSSFTLAAETFLGRGRLLYYGLCVIRADQDYQAWLAFSDQKGRQTYPRFFAGYAF